MNDETVDYLASFKIDGEYLTNIEVKNVDRNVFNKLSDLVSINIVVKLGEFITMVDCCLINYAFIGGPDIEDTEINMFYESSLLLTDYIWNPSQDINVDGIVCSITQTTELLGFYPYIIKYDKSTYPKIECEINGDLITKTVGNGFSFFVAPSISNESGEIHTTMYGRIQYSCKKTKGIGEIREIINGICLFFEVLSGEIITANEVYLNIGNQSSKIYGLYYYQKDYLKGLQQESDTRSYLRKRIFKASDFTNIESAIDVFIDNYKDSRLAFEAYKQILLDEEIRISTYNKFLKTMQVIEGIIRTPKDKEIENNFIEQKNEIIKKLDEKDGTFIKQYTTYNGKSFRKCLKIFVRESMNIISGISYTEADKKSMELIEKIINDRDLYTHASKEGVAKLSSEQLYKVNYCFKWFFRIIVLKKMGLGETLIKSRLSFDSIFIDYYRTLFGLTINIKKREINTGDFDSIMW